MTVTLTELDLYAKSKSLMYVKLLFISRCIGCLDVEWYDEEVSPKAPILGVVLELSA